MKYLYYLGCVVAAAFVFVLMPQNATSAEAAVWPTITRVQPAEVAINSAPSPYLVIEGSSWPNEMYGLTAYLLDADTNQQIHLTVVSYTPLSKRMVVEMPHWADYHMTSYDVVVSTHSGSRGILESGLRIVGELSDEEVVDETDSEVVDEEESESDVVVNRPETEVTMSHYSGAPRIISYTPDVVNDPMSGPVMVIRGYKWPLEMYGLQAMLRNPETNAILHMQTISYVPEDGRMVVQIPGLPDTGAIAYDLILSTNSGVRTVVHNGVWLAN